MKIGPMAREEFFKFCKSRGFDDYDNGAYETCYGDFEVVMRYFEEGKSVDIEEPEERGVYRVGGYTFRDLNTEKLLWELKCVWG